MQRHNVRDLPISDHANEHSGAQRTKFGCPGAEIPN
jgi:hypothetical protein